MTITSKRVQELIEHLKKNKELGTGSDHLEIDTGYGLLIKDTKPVFGEMETLFGDGTLISYGTSMILRVELVNGSLAVFLSQKLALLKIIDRSEMLKSAGPTFEYHFSSSADENVLFIRRYLSVGDYNDDESLRKVIQKTLQECERVYQKYKEPNNEVIVDTRYIPGVRSGVA